MSTIEGPPAQTRDVLMEPSTEITLSIYAALHDDKQYGEVCFAFNPLAGHPLAGDLPAQKRLFAQLWLVCNRCSAASWPVRRSEKPMRPWTLRHKEAMDLIIVFDWASKFRRQFPDQYDDDSHFYALIREMFCQIVNKSFTEAPSFESALELERDRNREEQRLLREYHVDCSRGGLRRTIAALLESLGLKEPPPLPEIGPEWEYRRFLAHNRQMETLVQWFSKHAAEIELYFSTDPIT